jgi:hypothetical protein
MTVVAPRCDAAGFSAKCAELVKPRLIPGTKGAIQVAVAGFSGCALVGEAPLCWTSDSLARDAKRGTVVPKTDGVRIVALRTRGDQLCTIDAEGIASCFEIDLMKGRLPVTLFPNAEEMQVADIAEAQLELRDSPGHTCVLSSSGSVHCDGDGRFGQLGFGGFSQSRDGYASVAGLADIVDVAAGSRHSCALSKGGKVWCWGPRAEVGLPAVDCRTSTRGRPGCPSGEVHTVDLAAALVAH